MSDTSSILEGVSRETIEKLRVYEQLLQKWSPRINLVARASLAGAWRRHILDSVQTVRIAGQRGNSWMDLGSGAGFPGIVGAMLYPSLTITLVESDKRKAEFMRTVLRETETKATILSMRIEHCPPANADILTARALAPLSILLEHAERHLSPNGVAVFPKGTGFRKELDSALANWSFRCEVTESLTEDGAAILSISEITRA